ncbi:MAG: ABC transporter permease, partial [Candidatus Zixiibacteriota bacterium]
MAIGVFLTSMFRDMKSQKMRTFLTVFGILWGTASVILLLAFGQGIHVRQQAAMKGLGDAIVIMWPGRTAKVFQGLPKNRQIRFREDDAVLLKQQVVHLGRLSPEYTLWDAKARVGKTEKLVRVTGCWPEFGEARNIVPQTGSRFINQEDMDLKRRVIFIGDELKDQLFGEQDAIGRMVLINGVPFTVVGVMRKKEQDSSYNGRDTQKAFIPSATFRAMYGSEYVNNIIFQADKPENTPTAKRSVYEVLGARYKFDPDDEEALSMWDTTEGEQFFS